MAEMLRKQNLPLGRRNVRPTIYFTFSHIWIKHLFAPVYLLNSNLTTRPTGKLILKYKLNNVLPKWLPPQKRSALPCSPRSIKLTPQEKANRRHLQTSRLRRSIPASSIPIPSLHLLRPLLPLSRRKRPLRSLHQLSLSLGAPRKPPLALKIPHRNHPNCSPRLRTRPQGMVL
jgi:hypothetical protein